MSEVPGQPCPFPSCGSSDAFSWNTDGYGKCHSCGTSYPHRGMNVFDWAKEQYPVPEKVDITKVEAASATYKNIRGLEPDVAKMYGIQLHKDAEGNPFRYAFKHPDAVKYRGYNEKKFWTEKLGQKFSKLFGPEFNAGTSKRIYLTEGEFDAASLFQVLGKTYPVKSIPSAGIGDKFLKENHAELDLYEQIVYAGELDDAGRKSADKLYPAYPHKLDYVPLNKHKDANEFLMQGDGDDLKWAALKPQRYSPQNFFTGDDEWERAIREQHPYQSSETGHSGLDKTTRGMVRGGITFIKAKRGTGKTEFFRYIQHGLLTNNEDVRIGLVHMEEMLSTTLRCFATYELGKNVRTEQDQEEQGVTTEEVIAAANKIKRDDHIVPFELLPSDEPLQIVEYCRMAATIYQCDFIFIDHIQRLIYRNGAENATGILTQVATQLAELGKELNVGIIAISHLNQDGGTQYASALENEAIVVIDIKRETDEDDERKRNTSEFVVTKNRPFSKLGSAGTVYYEPDTTILEESTIDFYEES